MSEGEIAVLRREIRDLSEKSDRQHAENRANQAQDREAFRQALETQQKTFSDAMNVQRDAFQKAINMQFSAQAEMDKRTELNAAALRNIVGDGEPGSGRLGVMETGMETMKKFRWQALTIVSLLMLAIEVWRHGG